jgi:hypothetical protein
MNMLLAGFMSGWASAWQNVQFDAGIPPSFIIGGLIALMVVGAIFIILLVLGIRLLIRLSKPKA